MTPFNGLSSAQLIERKKVLEARYAEYKAQGLSLDMSRGKPCTEQLNLSEGLLSDCTNLKAKDGTDCRNYGILDGIKEAKALFAELFEIGQDEVIIGGNSSLNLMYDLISKAYIHGLNGFEKPWSKLDKIKFLCPSPGYDRHFAITELFGMELIAVPMTAEGPDMDVVEKLAGEDEAVKGIWCTPKYSNPTGITFSDKVVERLASMKTKASDFLILWDNAYAVHHLYEEGDVLKSLPEACKAAGNPNRFYMFGSTSKVTYAGAGISIIASSKDNINVLKKLISIQTIGHDKINQLLHVRFLKDGAGTKALMKKHAEILRPKFECVLDILAKNLEGKDIAAWNKPRGGYFVSLDVVEGCAKRVVALAKEAGVVFTPAGATYPGGLDPRDSNIRIAPSFPPLAELKTAIEILCICVELAALEKFQ